MDQSEVPLGMYRHYKQGDIYCVLGVAKHEETHEDFVVYMAMYGDKQIYIRPKHIFMETVEQHGKQIPRFEYMMKSL